MNSYSFFRVRFATFPVGLEEKRANRGIPEWDLAEKET